MPKDLFLLSCAALIMLWSIGLLVHRRWKADTKPNALAAQTTYTDVGYFARQLMLYSVNASPAICFLAAFMLFIAIGFLIAEFVGFSLFGVLLVASALSLLALYVLAQLAAKKRLAFEKSLVEAIEIMQAASISGSTPQSALQAVADNSKGDIRREFSAMVTSLKYGATIEGAVARISSLYDSDGVRMLTQMLIARWNVGGSLNELMDAVSKMIRERVAIRLQVTSKLSGAKYAAIFMGLAPYLLVPFFLMSQPEWLEIFLTHPAGIQTLGWAFVAQVIGVVWLRKVLRVTL